jgi:hypothetical protein
VFGLRETSPMPQRPSAISLMLCDQVVFEQGTQKPYLLGVFTGLAADAFPTAPQRFDVFAALTDGAGDVTMTLSAVHLETNQEIYSQALTVRFSDPLRVVNLRFRVRQLIFQVAGTYLFALKFDDEEIAARRVRVYQEGGSP